MASIMQDHHTAAAHGGSKVFAFVFPMAAGHINPSLPVARSLLDAGHQVHYLCREPMREAVEDTGATFHSDVEVERELHDGRKPDVFGAVMSLAAEHGLMGLSNLEMRMMLMFVQVELQLPGLLRWLREIGAQGVMYCPLFNMEAAYAAAVLGIQSAALLTTAGPGTMPRTCAGYLRLHGRTQESLIERVLSFAPNRTAVCRLRATYGLEVDEFSAVRPLGCMDCARLSLVTLVTTSEKLQEPMTEDVAEAYRAGAVRFDFVGPLLDKAGARRAAGMNHKDPNTHAESSVAANIDVVDMVRRARSAGRRVVLASMGTVITSDTPEAGWEGRRVDKEGNKRGLCGRELCQAAWAGVFDVVREERAEDGPLVVVALGPQPNPLGDVVAPPNAVCLPMLPQVDILKAGVDVFVTHAGQNSFMEGLSVGAALVCCPGFADQPINALRAQDLGVGLQVPRPQPEIGGEADAAVAYRGDVAQALRRVLHEPEFSAAARECAASLLHAAGVPRATEWMLAAASTPIERLELRGKELAEPAAVVVRKPIHGRA